MRTRILLPLFLFVFNAACFAQHGTGDLTSAKEYNTILKSAERASRDISDLPSSFSLKKYAPTPGNQFNYGTCVAWSTSYGARTISYAVQNNLTDTSSINRFTFSPGYIYYKIKKPQDTVCTMGSVITDAMQVMVDKGNVLKKEGVFDCTSALPQNLENGKATEFKIRNFLALTSFREFDKEGVLKIKKSISEKKPVVLSLKFFPSLSNIKQDGIWKPGNDEDQRGNHALCIVGYDDNFAGGSFEIMNSWGVNWGNHGFFWLSYQQAIKYGNYAVEMMDFESNSKQEELSGKIDFIGLDETPMTVKRAKINTRSFEVEDDIQADFSLYKFSESYPGGTSFKIKFTTNAPAFVYIFSKDDKGIVSKFFPYNSTISPAINSSNATIYLPSETKHARISSIPGKENICVLYSKSELNFESLLSDINTNKVSISEAVKAKYQTRLLNLKEVMFEDNAINFKAPVNENSLLCFFIDLEHY